MTISTLKEYIVSLKNDIKKLDALIVFLESQYVLLSQRDIQLEEHNIKMLKLLDSLNDSHTKRDAFLVSLGLPSGKEGLTQLRSKLPSDVNAITNKLLQELEIKTKTCKMMNERSGQLLSSQRRLMQRLTGGENKQAYPEMQL
ncbi:MULTISPECIES: flagellar export chaperone FlgN [unclassified Pseudoalteromonas]|uniref:flagellar export chaperone FlgN n=1 Tax=unclassified Pseudoalteromonas TaxID=194690 RepID=UPI001C718DC6|nr:MULTISPECIES: flagellar export chaperone FlgN [unclassified Pseudoalteromonas]